MTRPDEIKCIFCTRKTPVPHDLWQRLWYNNESIFLCSRPECIGRRTKKMRFLNGDELLEEIRKFYIYKK